MQLVQRDEHVLDDAHAHGREERARPSGEAVQQVEHRVALVRMRVVPGRQVDVDGLAAAAERRARDVEARARAVRRARTPGRAAVRSRGTPSSSRGSGRRRAARVRARPRARAPRATGGSPAVGRGRPWSRLYDDRPEESLTPRLSQRYDVGFASRASASREPVRGVTLPQRRLVRAGVDVEDVLPRRRREARARAARSPPGSVRRRARRRTRRTSVVAAGSARGPGSGGVRSRAGRARAPSSLSGRWGGSSPDHDSITEKRSRWLSPRIVAP